MSNNPQISLADIAENPNALYTQRQIAPVLEKSESWFERGRWAGYGPKFIKIGRSVKYRGADVLAWLDSQTHRSTSDVA